MRTHVSEGGNSEARVNFMAGATEGSHVRSRCTKTVGVITLDA